MTKISLSTRRLRRLLFVFAFFEACAAGAATVEGPAAHALGPAVVASSAGLGTVVSEAEDRAAFDEAAARGAQARPERRLRETHGGTVVRVGMLDFESEASYLSRVEDIQETVLTHLERTTPGIVIERHRYKTSELAEAVRKGEVEFFLGSSGFFVEMRPYGVRDIGTIVSRSFPDPNQCVAGVIFVRRDRTDLKAIEDLEGQRAISTDPRNFMTFQIGMGEIKKAGFNPDKFFRRINFTNSVPTEVVRSVADGRADVGLLRACMLEAIEARNPHWQNLFRVIGEKKGPRADRLGCRYSTDMYPGWTFAVMPHTPPILTRHVAISLLSMRPEDTPSGFAVSFATNYASVNALFRDLRIGPYAYLREWTLARMLRVSWPFLLLAAGLAAAWVLHWWRLEKLVRRRTAALELAVDQLVVVHLDLDEAGDLVGVVVRQAALLALEGAEAEHHLGIEQRVDLIVVILVDAHGLRHTDLVGRQAHGVVDGVHGVNEVLDERGVLGRGGLAGLGKDGVVVHELFDHEWGPFGYGSLGRAQARPTIVA